MKYLVFILTFLLSVLGFNNCSQKEEYFDTTGYSQTESIPPVADFSYEIIKVDDIHAEVNFFDKSLSNPTEWQWLIGDDTYPIEEQNIIEKYLYDFELIPVTLKVKNNEGESTITKNVDLRLASLIIGNYEVQNIHNERTTYYEEIIYLKNNKIYFTNFAGFENNNIYITTTSDIDIPEQTLTLNYDLEYEVWGWGNFELDKKEITITITYIDTYNGNTYYSNEMILTRTLE